MLLPLLVVAGTKHPATRSYLSPRCALCLPALPAAPRRRYGIMRDYHCHISLPPHHAVMCLPRLPACPACPPCRYGIMRDYMPTRGGLGQDMMFRSCTVQVNLDFDSETDMVEKMRIGMALQVGGSRKGGSRRRLLGPAAPSQNGCGCGRC